MFTCAHELGHHAFGHGSTVDQLKDDAGRDADEFNPDEFLVNAFAGHLLMPVVAVKKAFADRGWDVAQPTPRQAFTVACAFGVGYETLVSHMAYALQLVSRTHADFLLKTGPKAIRAEILGRPAAEPLILADEHWVMPTLDAEVGNLLLLPAETMAEGNAVAAVDGPTAGVGRLFRAVRPGIVRASVGRTGWAAFLRISRQQFVGLSQYRHLEEVDDE